MANLKRALDFYWNRDDIREKWVQMTGGTPWETPPLYSFDNPSIHTDQAVLQKLGLNRSWPVLGALRLELPAQSPDLHRVIERTHANLCGKFQKWLNEDPQVYCMQGYCNVMAFIFYYHLKASSIQSDLDRIDALYQKVVDLKGRRAPPPFR